MIAIANTALLSQSAIYGCSILGCCCDRVEPEVGGRQFPPEATVSTPISDNPFISFAPIGPVETVEPEPLPVVTPIANRRILKRAILPEITSRITPLSTSRIVQGMKTLGIDIDELVAEEFQNYLTWEYDEFLALIIATDEDCCYECPN